MRTLNLLITLLLLTACAKKSDSPTSERGPIKPLEGEALNPGIPEQSIGDFNDYQPEGLILPGTVRVYGNSTKAIGQIEFESVTPVKILGLTETMYSLIDTTILCSGANFVKINYQNKDYTVFGADVYQTDSTQKSSVRDAAGGEYEIIAARHFEIGASTQEGLTSCDDYTMLIIRHGEKYSLIENPSKGERVTITGGKPGNDDYVKLVTDDGQNEAIDSVTFRNDSIRVNVKISFQEGSGAYRLQIAYDEKLSRAKIFGYHRSE